MCILAIRRNGRETCSFNMKLDHYFWNSIDAKTFLAFSKRASGVRKRPSIQAVKTKQNRARNNVLD